MYTEQDLQLLELICQEVESRGIDLATNFNDWVILTYGLVADFGETGRAYFHRICRLYQKGYSEKDCQEMYDYALKHSRDQAHFGSICYLANACGIDMKDLRRQVWAKQKKSLQTDRTKAEQKQKQGNLYQNNNLSPVSFFTQGRARNNGVGGESDPMAPADNQADANMEISLLSGSEPLSPLPLLYPGAYEWPWLIQDAISTYDDRIYRDVLLLGTLTLLSGAIGPMMHTRYSGRKLYPNLQTFVVAPPASGKGILTFVRRLTDPIHRERRRVYLFELQKYKKLHLAWADMGKKKVTEDEPEAPKNLLFYIPGDNTGTGIVQNLCDNNGSGVLFEVEADTLSSAISGDYGKFSDVLRKAFDHEGLSYNRRTNQEYREVQQTNLSVLISGTPAQVAPLIPSAENGLFSRELFYYMPAARQFISQFDADNRELDSHYDRLGLQFYSLLSLLKSSGHYLLLVSDDQKAAFNREMSRLFDRSVQVNNREMDSTVLRLAINVLRQMMVVALLRATEPTYQEVVKTGQVPRQLRYEPTLMEPTTGINQGQRSGAQAMGYAVYLREDDFYQVLSMAEPLFEHSLHILSLLQATEISRRTLSEQDKLFADLNDRFTTKEAKDMAEERGLNQGTVSVWIGRWLKKGLIGRAAERGDYYKMGTDNQAASDLEETAESPVNE